MHIYCFFVFQCSCHHFANTPVHNVKLISDSVRMWSYKASRYLLIMHNVARTVINLRRSEVTPVHAAAVNDLPVRPHAAIATM